MWNQESILSSLAGAFPAERIEGRFPAPTHTSHHCASPSRIESVGERGLRQAITLFWSRPFDMTGNGEAVAGLLRMLITLQLPFPTLSLELRMLEINIQKTNRSAVIARETV